VESPQEETRTQYPSFGTIREKGNKNSTVAVETSKTGETPESLTFLWIVFSGKDVDEGARDDNDESESEAERQRMMKELFEDDSDDVAEAEDEVEASKASRGGDGQPSLGHPNVSDREFV